MLAAAAGCGDAVTIWDSQSHATWSIDLEVRFISSASPCAAQLCTLCCPALHLGVALMSSGDMGGSATSGLSGLGLGQAGSQQLSLSHGKERLQGSGTLDGVTEL